MSMTCIMWRTLPGVVTGGLLALLATVSPVRAADDGPIKIGVISEEAAIVGQAISQGAQIAADDINKQGGVNGRKIEIVTYDDHSSAADAVRDS
jgi:branched-chain amino acid transport system substrate-binding protein